ncbi:hypothetical protein HNR73_001457 [Phytomonospora endophytica]|uniref:Uncharacterized protein n=1 Tax=Phytomonospora endophytica TaxID=714109 RepID=A0A841FKC9_9ACTN|nr:hypothetical protein [Phytomonospora endophytica]GIG64878.1 hypothetical protein Pen01_11730 [Phytomonospora endophytica]
MPKMTIPSRARAWAEDDMWVHSATVRAFRDLWLIKRCRACGEKTPCQAVKHARGVLDGADPLPPPAKGDLRPWPPLQAQAVPRRREA